MTVTLVDHVSSPSSRVWFLHCQTCSETSVWSLFVTTHAVCCQSCCRHCSRAGISPWPFTWLAFWAHSAAKASKQATYITHARTHRMSPCCPPHPLQHTHMQRHEQVHKGKPIPATHTHTFYPYITANSLQSTNDFLLCSSHPEVSHSCVWLASTGQTLILYNVNTQFTRSL